MQSLFGNLLFPQSQLLCPYVFVSMPHFLFLENWLLYLFGLLLSFSFVVDYLLDHLFHCLLCRVIGMACRWLNDGWNLWGFVFTVHLFLLTPHVLHWIVEQWLLLDSVIVLGFRKRLWAVLKTIWIERFSDFVVFVLNNESRCELFPDFLSMLFLHFLE